MYTFTIYWTGSSVSSIHRLGRTLGPTDWDESEGREAERVTRSGRVQPSVCGLKFLCRKGWTIWTHIRNLYVYGSRRISTKTVTLFERKIRSSLYFIDKKIILSTQNYRVSKTVTLFERKFIEVAYVLLSTKRSKTSIFFMITCSILMETFSGGTLHYTYLYPSSSEKTKVED